MGGCGGGDGGGVVPGGDGRSWGLERGGGLCQALAGLVLLRVGAVRGRESGRVVTGRGGERKGTRLSTHARHVPVHACLTAADRSPPRAARRQLSRASRRMGMPTDALVLSEPGTAPRPPSPRHRCRHAWSHGARATVADTHPPSPHNRCRQAWSHGAPAHAGGASSRRPAGVTRRGTHRRRVRPAVARRSGARARNHLLREFDDVLIWSRPTLRPDGATGLFSSVARDAAFLKKRGYGDPAPPPSPAPSPAPSPQPLT